MSDSRTPGPSGGILHRIWLIATLIGLAATMGLLVTGRAAHAGPFVVGGIVAFALFAAGNRVLKVISFSIWMVAFVAAPMFYPAAFLQWGSVSLKPFIIPLIMSVLFCMGTTLSIGDFKRVIMMPKAVIIGVALTFTIAPIAGKVVAVVLDVNPEVAAGMVLVGASPGGVASNVITFLASGNVALSVTMTAIETLLSPFATPLITKWLAGTYVPVSLMAMMLSIFKMVILPIGGGLFAHWFLERMGRVHPIYMKIYRGIMVVLPKLSMFAIIMACAIMTANARDQLLVGSIIISVLASVMLQNILGLFFGYWFARMAGIGEKECRTVAIEVGLKNSGMSAALALDVLKSDLASIPGVVYSSWHNVTGALLASWWSNNPPKDT